MSFEEGSLAKQLISVKNVDDLLLKVKAYDPQARIDILEKAYYFSEKAHEGQIRRSGEPYISHPLSVASILADLRMDLETIMAGLLHDTVEDTAVTVEQIRNEFGEGVANIVDGVTKISKLKFRNSSEQQGENIRKMIVAMGKDVRVVLVKLADRLHNMRTLKHMAFEKQARIAQETLEIYAPLASRLGISAWKVELEDLSFRYYRPDIFYDLQNKVQEQQKDQSKFIEEVKKKIHEVLGETGLKNFEVSGRSKHLWSIYRKMQARHIEYEQIYDVLAFRVLVDTIPQCYEVLGHIHALWKPIPGRFKDFIAMPKANHYQSLHTTVISIGGERIEIQIRTHNMHLVAERGIAAHWKYKEKDRKVEAPSAEKFDWLRNLLEWNKQTRNSEEFLDSVKTDLFEGEIYVFTPKGEVKELPEGATPIDFAYSIHTDVGHRTVGARVNGKMVPIKYQLQNGDTVEIVTSVHQHPSKDWLKICVTNRARSKIRAFVKEEQHQRSLAVGKELLDKEFRKYSASAAKYLGKSEKYQQLLKDFGIHNDEELFVKVGYGKLEPKTVLERLAPELRSSQPQEAPKDDGNFIQKVFKAVKEKQKKSKSLVSVDGMEDLLIHYAKCCNPIPGDPITGFITRGRGITIHRSDCVKAFAIDQERKVEVAWTEASQEQRDRVVKIRVESTDTPGLLKSMTETFSAQGINIHKAQVHTTRDKKAICTFDVHIKNTQELTKVILELQKIRGVLAVSRMMQK